MLRASRHGLWKYRYELTEDDRPLTRLAGFRREGCEFTLDGEPLRVNRKRGKRFELHGPDGLIASADRASGRRWMITTPGQRLVLVKPSIWRSAWELHHDPPQDDRSLGRIEPEGVWGRASHADLSARVPLPVRVFAYYVVLILWERAGAAAAAS